MQDNYHAVIINLSQKTKEIFNQYKVMKIQKRFLGLLKLYKIEVPESDIENAIDIVQSNMSNKLSKEWYAVFYNSKIAVIVFKKRVFRASTKGIIPEYQKVLDTSKAEDKNTWDEIIIFGKSLGIPDSQLDFLPPNFANEQYY